MSLITRCPACKTMFKVVPDQLRISEGWVRCGQCDEIFDASAQLQGKDNAVSQPMPLQVQDAAAQEPRPLAATHTLNDPVLEQAVAGEAVLSGKASTELVEPSLDDATIPAPDTAFDAEERTALPRSEGDVAIRELSFMREGKSRSRWTRPWVRAALLLVALSLGLLLALQITVFERDRIAVIAPGLKPWVEEVCAFMECTVEPLRQIESVVIDSSAFNKIRGDVYRLNFSLKNTAPVELALPAIELSLTDIHDQAVVRRVFQPGELGVKSDTLQAASEFSTSLTLGIKSNGGADRIAGYRILAFYP